MRITYLELKNFASIYTGMKKKRIKIDFTKRKHRVTILVGETGSGKTSILSELNPYAYSTNDNRSSSELIIEGEDGYKEIHIENDDVKYVIKHYYHNKGERIAVKSFITRNGEEMNPNGNVTSFKVYVEEELHVTPDYMKLLRLGPNVETFIKMSTADRKYFISELLSEIGTYNSYYKKVSEDVRTNNTLIKSVGERIRRIGVEDPRVLQASLDETNEELVMVQKELAETVGQIWTIRANLDQEKDKMGVYAESYQNLPLMRKSVLRELEKTKEKYDRVLSSQEGVQNLDEYKLKLTTSIQQVMEKTESLSSSIHHLLEEEVRLYKEKEEKEAMIQYASSEEDYESLTSELAKEIRLKENGDKKFRSGDKPFNPTYTTDDLKLALRLLMEIQHIIENIYGYERKAVQEVVSDFLNGRPVLSRVGEEIDKIDRKIVKLKSATSDVLDHAHKTYVIIEPEGHHNCPYKEIYEQSLNLHKNKEDKSTVQEKIRALEVEREFYEVQPDILKNVEYILFVLNNNKENIEKLPFDYFNLKRILQCVHNYEVIYDEEKITMEIERLGEYEDYLKIEERIEQLEKERTQMKQSSTLVTTIQKDINQLATRLFTISSELKSHRIELDELKVQLDEQEATLDGLDSMKELENKLHTLQDQLKEYDENIQKSMVYEQTKETYEKQLAEALHLQRRYEESERNLQNAITDFTISISELTKLREEQIRLQESYDDLYILRKSLSSTEGIPLLFIRLYMDKTLQLVNELLFEVYGGDFEIEQFIINEKEFRIPYIKNGVRVSDVSQCSQGEESFVMIALSFALLANSIEEFDIIALDEVDGPLDIEKREKFIANLEKFLDLIGAEQVNIISHNNVFDNYPVDVIRTSDVVLDNYRNVNVIYSV